MFVRPPFGVLRYPLAQRVRPDAIETGGLLCITPYVSIWIGLYLHPNRMEHV
jgi:hypothetical protein